MVKDSENLDLLRRIEIFGGVSDDALVQIDVLCRWQNFRLSQEIIGHLDETTDCFLIARGAVRVVVNSSAGKEIAFRDIGAGETVGELSALDGRRRSASVIALTDTRVGRLSSKGLWTILEDQPDVCRALIRKLTGLVRQLSDRVVAVSAMPVGPRVQAELLRLAHAVGVFDNRAVILNAPTHAEIASLVAARREAVSREMSRLADAGVINRRGRDLVVIDVAALRNSIETTLDIGPR